jgi:hypothetical protein
MTRQQEGVVLVNQTVRTFLKTKKYVVALLQTRLMKVYGLAIAATATLFLTLVAHWFVLNVPVFVRHMEKSM